MSASEPDVAVSGIPGSGLPGPYPVGEYAAALRERLRDFAHVQIVGEMSNLRVTRARSYFELRDERGAIPCAMWRERWDKLAEAAGQLADGVQVVVAGGCDYYAGSATSSPSFSFDVTALRIAGEGDLLARIERLRRKLDAEGLLEPQKQLPLPSLPRSIGVVCGEGSKARDDVLAGLHRRGWPGRLVWAFAPVQDRHAAPRITQALAELVAVGGVEVIIVARGGGSLTDLLAFSEETLCRTVALLPVPVIASIGHHTDRTLLDDVAALSCSTPTHAAEAAVPVHCGEARVALVSASLRLAGHGRRAVVSRARTLASLSRAPAEHVLRHRGALHQQLRELRAGSRRRHSAERDATTTRAIVLQRKLAAARIECSQRRVRELERLTLTLGAHDPQRTLERGYALVSDRAGEPIVTAAQARKTVELTIRFADDSAAARIEEL